MEEIKIGDKTFEFTAINTLDESVTNALNEWVKRVKKQESDEPNEDIWTTLPEVPQYKFKNLKLTPNNLEDSPNEITFNFTYEDFIKI